MNKGRTFTVEILSPQEATALIAACGARSPTGIRNRALLTLLYRGGLRIGEALKLAVRDYQEEPNGATVRIRNGKRTEKAKASPKGRAGPRRVKPRTVGLDTGAAYVIGKWLERRRKLGLPESAPLFCTLSKHRRGEELWASYVASLLKRKALKAGIQKRVHPHGLRHAHAAELAREGVNIAVIRDQLGHHSLATTDIYLRSIAPADVIKTMQGRTWEPPK